VDEEQFPKINFIPRREELIPEKRKALSKKKKLELLIKFPRCPMCGEKWESLSEIDWDHSLPLALGGKQTDDNWQPLHRTCHKQKTKSDVSRISKSARLARKRLCPKTSKKKIPSRGFPKKPTEA
jgi:5-methylcytosine-specific restriction endonuclease McrA